MKAVKKVAYVLKKSLRKKGSAGDVVNVTRGFGRYLESQGIAQRANEEILKSLEAQKHLWQKAEEAHIKEAQKLVEKIKDIQIVLKKRVAQGEKLYESVRPESIVEAFRAQGVEVSNHNIKLNTQIKKTGKHSIIVHAYGNCEVELTIDVVAEDTM